MTAARVCLTLVAGRELRQELFDYLGEQTDLMSGFTASEASGHGPTVRLHSAVERVKGRADRVLVRIILDDAAAGRLIERLARAFAGTHLVYWMTPVARFGVID
ncbi:MAG: DUF3240 family protein [Xanthobacteraceae bacterium]